MESSGIYEDLNDLSIGDKLIKAQEENKKLLQHIETLEGDIRKLCKELTQMKVKESNLKKNISELFNTATMETNRKQKMINDLQDKLDSLQFGRGKYNFHSAKRSRDDEDVIIIEPKKAKTDVSENDKHRSRETVRSRSSNKDDNFDTNNSRKKSSSSYREKHDQSTKDKYNTKTPSHSKEYHRRSRSKSKYDVNPPQDKSNHQQKLKLNNSYFNTDIKIEVKNNERVISKVSVISDKKFTKRDSSLKREFDEDVKSVEKIKMTNGEQNPTSFLQVKTEPDEDVKNAEKHIASNKIVDTVKDGKKNDKSDIKTERIILPPKLEQGEIYDCDEPEPNPQKTDFLTMTTSIKNNIESSHEKPVKDKRTTSKQSAEYVKKEKINNKINRNIHKTQVTEPIDVKYDSTSKIKRETILCKPKIEDKSLVFKTETNSQLDTTTVDSKENLNVAQLQTNNTHNNPTTTCFGSTTLIKTEIDQKHSRVLDSNVGEKKLTVSSGRRRRCVIKMN